LGTLPSMQAAAAVTASAVSLKGSKWRRLTYFLALVESEKNFSCRSSVSVLESFLSSVIYDGFRQIQDASMRCERVVSTRCEHEQSAKTKAKPIY
jgi:hypothetical protein